MTPVCREVTAKQLQKRTFWHKYSEVSGANCLHTLLSQVVTTKLTLFAVGQSDHGASRLVQQRGPWLK